MNIRLMIAACAALLFCTTASAGSNWGSWGGSHRDHSWNSHSNNAWNQHTWNDYKKNDECEDDRRGSRDWSCDWDWDCEQVEPPQCEDNEPDSKHDKLISLIGDWLGGQRSGQNWGGSRGHSWSSSWSSNWGDSWGDNCGWQPPSCEPRDKPICPPTGVPTPGAAIAGLAMMGVLVSRRRSKQA